MVGCTDRFFSGPALLHSKQYRLFRRNPSVQSLVLKGSFKEPVLFREYYWVLPWHDYSRFKSVLLADQITVSGNEISV